MKKNIKINLFWSLFMVIVLVSVVGSLQSCSNDENLNLPTNEVSQLEMISLMNNKLFLQNDMYKFEMTLIEARSVGISDVEYYKMKEIVANTNNKIKDLKSKGLFKMKLVDPQKTNVLNKFVRFKTYSENNGKYQDSFTMSCSMTQTESGNYTSRIGSISLTGTSNYSITIFSGYVKTGFGNINFSFQPGSEEIVRMNAYPCSFNVKCATNNNADNTLKCCYTM